MNVEYRYAEGDLLGEPNTYAYAPYTGEAFLDVWRQSRLAVLATLPPPEDSPAVDGRSNGGDTLAYLDHVCRRLQRQDASAPADLDSLLRRFEVSKRIYRRYSDRWRPEDETDFREPAPYLRFAEALELAYETTGHLTYLNALLKCLDTLVAIRESLARSDGGRLARLIAREREHVEVLDTIVARQP